jgi:hypothetical protein
MFLWRLLMDSEIPTPAKGVYIFLDYIALGFVLTAIEELVRRGWWDAWKTCAVCLFLGAAFLCMGIMGPRVKSAIESRFPWVRLKRELAAALSQIEDLKKNQPSTGDELKEANERADKNFKLYDDQNREFHELKAALREATGDIERLKAKHAMELNSLFPSNHGLVIKSAKWSCTVYPEKASLEKKDEVQKRVNQKESTLAVLAHNMEFGDVCELHGLHLNGHPKVLEVEYFQFGRITVPYCHEALIHCECPPPSLKRRDDLL